MKGNLAFWALKGTIILLISCGMRGPAAVSGGESPVSEGVGSGGGRGVTGDNPYPIIDSIPPPAGYHRLPQPKQSFGAWLRQVGLKRDRRVRLYDGSLKRNQDAQFAVLNIPVGHKDLQQCADAVMRLRAEYLYSLQDYADMGFVATDGTLFRYEEWVHGRRFRQQGPGLKSYTVAVQGQDPANRDCFEAWLELVFSYCGTLSLERQLMAAGPLTNMKPGDVLIHGGSPGHAMIVVDMAEDAAGHKAYMLAQSYMPAQDVHIVRNPGDEGLSPWYRVDDAGDEIGTPEWVFTGKPLRTWPGRQPGI